MSRTSCRGFTLVELLVVIAIIGVLIAMSLPALMASREAGRRNLCQANLARIVLALQSYENGFEAFPSGVVNPDGPIRNEARGLHQGWLIPLLPYLDEQNAYALIDRNESVYAPANAALRDYWPRLLICPSETNNVVGSSNYAACHHGLEAPIAADNNGVLFLNSHVRRDDISDGLSHTILVGEKPVHPGDLGWLSGTRATLRNTGSPLNAVHTNSPPPATPSSPQEAEAALLYVGGFASAHPTGAFVGFGDASVEFISEEVDQQLWQNLGNRADGQLTSIPGSVP
jgi:prepilin-type N-terminal cleavage/methylation domain-containing protein